MGNPETKQKPCCWSWFLLDPSSIIALPCPSMSHTLALLNFVQIVGWLLYGFVKIATCISHPLQKKTNLKFDQGFKSWSFCFELKLLSETKYSMPWTCCAFGNVCCKWCQVKQFMRRLLVTQRVIAKVIINRDVCARVRVVQPNWMQAVNLLDKIALEKN